jgi:pyruvate dehydrogenase E2 component (dihydrolipoamide acetyltransferase)
MEQATVVAWCAAVGDRVEKGQELVELETEKIVNMVEAPADGILREILVKEGEIAAVGKLLAIFAEEDEPYDIESLSTESTADHEEIRGLGTRAAGVPERTTGGRIRISPAARRLSAKYDLELDHLQATGPGGSLTRGDIERAIEQRIMDSLESCYLDIGGLKIHYLLAGGAKAGLREPSPTVILLHGIGGSTALWQANLTALAVLHPVVAVDLPGHGLSDKPPGDYSLDFFSAVISGLLGELGSEPVVLVGHSLGGHIALQVALEHPDKVGRLVLVASGGLGPDLHLEFLEKILSGLDLEATRSMLQGLFHDSAFVTRPILETTYENLSKPGAWEALVSTVSAYRARPYKRVEELTIPSLLVFGARDTIVASSYGKEAQARFANSQLWIAEDCGHCPQIEKSGEFNERLISFLAQGVTGNEGAKRGDIYGG